MKRLSLVIFLSSFSWAEIIDPIPVRNCSKTEAYKLNFAIEGAANIAQACLIQAELNPELGHRVVESLDKKTVAFECAESRFGEGGGTSRSDVKIVTWPPLEFTYLDDNLMEFTVFHELLHAIDPDGDLTATTALHNIAYPDPTYGCDYACRGSLAQNKERTLKRLQLYEIAMQDNIPQLLSWPCQSNDAQECQAIRKFAWLCQNSSLYTRLRYRVPSYELVLAYCLDVSLDYCKNPACQRENQGYDDEIKLMYEPSVTTNLATGITTLNITRAYLSAEQNPFDRLPSEEKTVALALQKEGFIDKCRTDPFWFRHPQTP